MWCVIPVAGRATRLGGSTAGDPKALLSVGGRPLLAHLLDRLGPPVADVCLVSATPNGGFRERFGDRWGDVRLHYAVQSDARGVAHAVGRAEPMVEGTFVALIGDSYFADPLAPYILRWQETLAAGGVLVEPTAGGRPGEAMGLVELAGESVTRIFKAPYTGQASWRVCGMMMLPEQFFAALGDVEPAESGEYELEEVVTLLIEGGTEFRAIRYAGWRRNVNTPADLDEVRRRVVG
jgi:glucose-1-phosphate thymidylyltransferase